MRIAIGSDHAGFALKEDLAAYLRELRHQVLDVGTHSTAPVDYPDYAEAVGNAVLDGRAERVVAQDHAEGVAREAADEPRRALEPGQPQRHVVRAAAGVGEPR